MKTSPVTITPAKGRTLTYDPETGHFSSAGKRRGWKNDLRGYRKILFEGKRFSEHRLAWFFFYGKWPDEEIDHKNLIKYDNRIINLREASRSENQRNTLSRKGTTSSYKGVSWKKTAMKWEVFITVDGKNRWLGYFENEIDAAAAFNKEAEKNYGEFANLNNFSK